MNRITLIFKNIYKSNYTIYFLLGSTAFLFKFISKSKLFILLLVIIISYNLLKKYIRFSVSFQSLLSHLKWIIIPIFIYSFFFEPKFIGLLMIAHFFSDTIARIIRTYVKPFYHKYLPKDMNGTLFFILSYFILSLLYIYIFDGFILRRYIPIFFINAVVLGLFENSFKIFNYPDNFNINVFGSLFILLSLFINFKLQINSQNFIFGLLIICPLFLLLLISFDIIKLKSIYKYYPLFVLLYGSFGVHLFLFHIFIFAGMGVIKKINQRYNPAINYSHTFIDILETKEYFFLSFILVFIFLFIPHSEKILKTVKMSAAAGLITALLHYFYHNLHPYLHKNYLSFKKFRISREILFYNMGISLTLLLSAYFLSIIKLLPLLFAFILINIYMISYIYLRPVLFNIKDNKLIKYLIPYFSFKIFFLFQLL